MRHGDEQVADLRRGDFFGEMGVVGKARRNATVVATSPMTIVVMTGLALRQVSREMPVVADRIRDAVAERSAAPETGQ